MSMHPNKCPRAPTIIQSKHMFLNSTHDRIEEIDSLWILIFFYIVC